MTYLSIQQRDAGPLETASTTMVGDPCLVVLLANHRGLGSKQVSGFEKTAVGLSPQRSVANTLAVFVRVND